MLETMLNMKYKGTIKYDDQCTEHETRIYMYILYFSIYTYMIFFIHVTCVEIYIYIRIYIHYICTHRNIYNVQAEACFGIVSCRT